MIGMRRQRGSGSNVQYECTAVREAPSAPVGRTPGPESERKKPGRTANRGPGVRITRPTMSPVAKVNEESAVRRQVAAIFIDAPMKPGAVGETITSRIPEYQLHPLARSPPEDQPDGLVSGKDHRQFAVRGRHGFHLQASGAIHKSKKAPACRL